MDTNKRFSINVKLQQLNRRWHQRKNSSLSARWIGKKATAWKKETPKLISSKLIAYYCHINYKRTVHTHCIRTTLLFSLSFLLFKTNDSDLRTVASSKHKNVSHNALNFFFFFFQVVQHPVALYEEILCYKNCEDRILYLYIWTFTTIFSVQQFKIWQ